MKGKKLNRDELIAFLTQSIPVDLARDITDSFIELRQDMATSTLGRTSPGKFVETFVQILQFMEQGKFDKKPSVDSYLKGLEGRSSSLNDGLRICASRVGRSMYTIRNKRNIAHKGSVDPNTYDLNYLLSSAQWILAELIRELEQISMSSAGNLVEQIQVPIDPIIEFIDGKRLVIAKISIRNEILTILHSVYPNRLTYDELITSMDRRSKGSVQKKLRELWREKYLEGSNQEGYKLTRIGYNEAIQIIHKAVEIRNSDEA